MGPIPHEFKKGDPVLGNPAFTDGLNIVAGQAAEPVLGDGVTTTVDYKPGGGYTVHANIPETTPPEEVAEGFWAQLELPIVNEKYSWREIRYLEDGTFETWAQSRYGTTSAASGTNLGPAYEANGTRGLSAGVAVWMHIENTPNGGPTIYVFEFGAEAVGQYLGMAHLVVAQNVGGWDFVRWTCPL